MMRIVYGAFGSFVLDLLLGDPEWMPHPVVLMGKGIRSGEKWLRGLFPDTQAGEKLGGMMLAVSLPTAVWISSGTAVKLLERVHPAAGFGLQVLWGWQCLALKDLCKESGNVYRTLTEGTPEQARAAVSRIVGRDTDRLTAEGVAKAAVETVAENFSDGVIAPLLYLLVGGAPLSLAYKAVNTMDSMIGYKNEWYLYFGRTAAKLDDAANYLPSRLSALLLIGAAGLCGENAGDALRIWRRDRRRSASPNAGQTESAMAGALGLTLGGPAWYFGDYYQKPTIGDGERQAVPEDILRANRLIRMGSVMGLLLLGGLRAGLVSGRKKVR